MLFYLMLMIFSIGIHLNLLGGGNVDALGKILYVNFLGFAQWFLSISISQMKDHSILVDKARYGTSVVDNYIDTTIVRTNKKSHKTNFISDMIFTMDDASTSDEQVHKLTRRFNVHYRACIGSVIYLLYTRVYLTFAVHKLESFRQILVKYIFRDRYICWDTLGIIILWY